MRKQRNAVEQCKRVLRERLEYAAKKLKESLLARYHSFVFSNDDHEEENRKLWEPIRAEWRQCVEPAITDAVSGILKLSKHLERAAEQQGALAGELFARTIIQVFCFSAASRRELILPPGLGEGEDLYREECRWIESVLYKLLAPEFSMRAELPSKKFLNLSRLPHLRYSGLTGRQMDCFSLQYEYKLSEQAIARKLKLSRRTVRDHLKAALKKVESSGLNIDTKRISVQAGAGAYSLEDLMKDEIKRKGTGGGRRTGGTREEDY